MFLLDEVPKLVLHTMKFLHRLLVFALPIFLIFLQQLLLYLFVLGLDDEPFLQQSQLLGFEDRPSLLLTLLIVHFSGSVGRGSSRSSEDNLYITIGWMLRKRTIILASLVAIECMRRDAGFCCWILVGLPSLPSSLHRIASH